MTSTAIPTPETPERVNSFARVFGVLFSPKATFESIARRPTWLVPVILICITALGVVAIFGHKGGWPSYLEKQVQNSARFQQLPADQRERAMEMQLKIAPRIAYAQVVIAPFLVVLVIAAVYLGVFNLMVGTKIGFSQSMAVAAFAWSPFIIHGLLAVLVVALKDPTTVDLQNLVASDVGSYLPSDSSKWLLGLTHGLDLFSFWAMALLAMGYRAAAAPKKVSFGTALGWIIGVWLFYMLIRTGLVAAFS